MDKVDEKEVIKKDIEYARLLGEFVGTLTGITYWDIPKELKVKIEAKIQELENDKRGKT